MDHLLTYSDDTDDYNNEADDASSRTTVDVTQGLRRVQVRTAVLKCFESLSLLHTTLLENESEGGEEVSQWSEELVSMQFDVGNTSKDILRRLLELLGDVQECSLLGMCRQRCTSPKSASVAKPARGSTFAEGSMSSIIQEPSHFDGQDLQSGAILPNEEFVSPNDVSGYFEDDVLHESFLGTTSPEKEKADGVEQSLDEVVDSTSLVVDMELSRFSQRPTPSPVIKMSSREVSPMKAFHREGSLGQVSRHSSEVGDVDSGEAVWRKFGQEADRLTDEGVLLTFQRKCELLESTVSQQEARVHLLEGELHDKSTEGAGLVARVGLSEKALQIARGDLESRGIQMERLTAVAEKREAHVAVLEKSLEEAWTRLKVEEVLRTMHDLRCC
jgi:hypothetical protein